MLKIWHRWACGYEIENTLASFAKAIDLWIDMIELDLHICTSGELIVFHDQDLFRILGIDKYIYMMDFSEISSYKLTNNQSIPRLSQVLDLINRRVKINIEIKNIAAIEPLLDLLSHYISQKWRTWNDFLISSFDHYAICLAKKLQPNIYIWALSEWIMIWYADFAEKLWCYSLHTSIEFANAEIVNDAHNRWLQLYIYTCNTKLQIQKAYDLWADGIISDFPDMIIYSPLNK